MIGLKKPILEKKWYLCPYCKTKLLLYSNNAISKGLYLKCKKCKAEIEIKI